MTEVVVDKSVWGPAFWVTLFTVAKTVALKSPQQKQHALEFFRSMMHVLPCAQCRAHYRDLWVRFPIQKALSSNAALVNWVSKIKQQITISLSKSVQPIKKRPIFRRSIKPRAVRSTTIAKARLVQSRSCKCNR